jgi:hypothetical protein
MSFNWKKVSWAAVFAIAVVVVLGVTLVLPNTSAELVYTLGTVGVIAAILSLRDQ